MTPNFGPNGLNTMGTQVKINISLFICDAAAEKQRVLYETKPIHKLWLIEDGRQRLSLRHNHNIPLNVSCDTLGSTSRVNTGTGREMT